MVQRADLENGRWHTREVRAERGQVGRERIDAAGDVAVGEELHHRPREHNLLVPEHLRRGKVEDGLEYAVHEDRGGEWSAIALVAEAQERGRREIRPGRSSADRQALRWELAIGSGGEPARCSDAVVHRGGIGMLRRHPVADRNDRNA